MQGKKSFIDPAKMQAFKQGFQNKAESREEQKRKRKEAMMLALQDKKKVSAY
jgi:hypothetical protein